MSNRMKTLTKKQKAIVDMMRVIAPKSLNVLRRALREKDKLEMDLCYIVSNNIKDKDMDNFYKERLTENNQVIEEWFITARKAIAEDVLTELSGKETHVDLNGQVEDRETREDFKFIIEEIKEMKCKDDIHNVVHSLHELCDEYMMCDDYEEIF